VARFHVHHIDRGYALDVQSNLLDRLDTRVMIPLTDASRVVNVMSKLNPIFVVNGTRYLLSTERMASVPVADIGPSAVDLTSKADEIAAALDFLFLGF
jgi:toxin CcdB